jgi:hypothetical protein
MTPDETRDLQSRLVALGYGPLRLDGQYGPATTRAVTAFQRRYALVADGIAGPATLAALANAAADPPATPIPLELAIASVASDLQIPERALRAVLAVESSGRGLGDDGRPVIRLELHLLRPRRPELFDGPDLTCRILGPQRWEGHEVRLPGGWVPLHLGGQEREWAAYDLVGLVGASEAASLSSSWGAAQILGSHCARLGYQSATAMATAFRDEAEQIRAFGRFLATGKTLVESARSQDWATFAREYNGGGQVTYYAGALRKAFERGAPP